MESSSNRRTSAAEHVGALFVNGDVSSGGGGSNSKLWLTCAVVTGNDDDGDGLKLTDGIDKEKDKI